MIGNVFLQPRQLIPFSKKTKEWRKANVNWADNKMRFDLNAIRNDAYQKMINYDLINGKIHIEDIATIINPELLKAKFIPSSIQHYPIINSKLSVLRGEESKRLDDFSVIVTNPTGITDIENAKKEAMYLVIQLELLNLSLSEEEFLLRLKLIEHYFKYEWLDFREIRANFLLNHYSKELNHNVLYNEGFVDAMAVGEELYRCCIEGGEPVLKRLNPKHVKIYMLGFNQEVEKADMIILTEYLSPGLIYDEFYDVLSKKDIDYIETKIQLFATGNVDTMDNWDERKGWFPYSVSPVSAMPTVDLIFTSKDDDYVTTFAPFDLNGNIRVLRVFWKSRRRIKKIKYYDPLTGNEEFTFTTEAYIPNESLGEEEQSFWINEAWEGTKIGEEIFLNIRPCPVLYNRLSNPSRCHFGIIGTIYNINDDEPFSLVSMAKPYNYLYDVIHDRLNKLMSRNWGKMTRLNLALKPSTWDVDKWLYYAKTMGLYVEDGFNEGNYGKSTGVLAGAMNMNSTGVIDADFGNNIQLYINMLEYIKQEMADVMGISKQREGLISNRETVGGVERATLLSSHITEYLFTLHEYTKKRVRECFIETAKAALKGRSLKFKYMLPDHSFKIIEIDGDEFAECDYGIVIDDSNNTLEFQLKVEQLALAALLNSALSFSTIMKLFSSCSNAEKQRLIDHDEELRRLEAQQQQLLQMLMQQQQLQAEMQQKQMEMQLKDAINQRDNDTRITVAEINSQAEFAVLQLKNHMTAEDKQDEIDAVQINKDKLMADMLKLDKLISALQAIEDKKLELLNKQFNANLKIQELKLAIDKLKALNKKS